MIHEDCEYYVAQNDMCLLYFHFGFFNVSQYKDCLEKEVYGGDLNEIGIE